MTSDLVAAAAAFFTAPAVLSALSLDTDAAEVAAQMRERFAQMQERVAANEALGKGSDSDAG